MQNNKEFRAKQFMPFDSLRGLREALREKEEILVPKKELSDEQYKELNDALFNLKKGDVISVVYFNEGKYIKLEGYLTKINLDLKYLQIVQQKISFENLYEIKK